MADEKLAIDRLMDPLLARSLIELPMSKLMQLVAEECARIAEQYTFGMDAARKIELEFRLGGKT